jgi:hypothetical protein
MKFARVQGHGRLITDGGEPMVSFAVMLDSSSSVTVVRDEAVPWLAFGPDGDVVWQIDQLTQETIGTTLADEGWEVVSQDERANLVDDDGVSHSSLFIARKASWE